MVLYKTEKNETKYKKYFFLTFVGKGTKNKIVIGEKYMVEKNIRYSKFRE